MKFEKKMLQKRELVPQAYASKLHNIRFIQTD